MFPCLHLAPTLLTGCLYSSNSCALLAHILPTQLQSRIIISPARTHQTLSVLNTTDPIRTPSTNMPVSSFLRKRVTTLTASSPSPSAIPAKMTPPKIQARPNRSPSLSEDPTWSNVAVNSNSLSSSSPTPGKLDDVRSFFKRAPGTTQLERVHGLDSATGNSQSALTSSTDTADLVTPPLSLAVPAVEFVLFPKLPAEIQLMICRCWKSPPPIRLSPVLRQTLSTSLC